MRSQKLRRDVQRCSEAVTEIIAADLDLGELKDHVRERLPDAPIVCEGIDGSDEASLRRLMAARPAVVEALKSDQEAIRASAIARVCGISQLPTTACRVSRREL